MKDFAEFATRVKWNEPPKPLTKEDLIASLPPRHKDCACPLCELDNRVAKSAVEMLFGNKE